MIDYYTLEDTNLREATFAHWATWRLLKRDQCHIKANVRADRFVQTTFLGMVRNGDGPFQITLYVEGEIYIAYAPNFTYAIATHDTLLGMPLDDLPLPGRHLSVHSVPPATPDGGQDGKAQNTNGRRHLRPV